MPLLATSFRTTLRGTSLCTTIDSRTFCPENKKLQFQETTNSQIMWHWSETTKVFSLAENPMWAAWSGKLGTSVNYNYGSYKKQRLNGIHHIISSNVICPILCLVFVPSQIKFLWHFNADAPISQQCSCIYIWKNSWMCCLQSEIPCHWLQTGHWNQNDALLFTASVAGHNVRCNLVNS